MTTDELIRWARLPERDFGPAVIDCVLAVAGLFCAAGALVGGFGALEYKKSPDEGLDGLLIATGVAVSLIGLGVVIGWGARRLASLLCRPGDLFRMLVSGLDREDGLRNPLTYAAKRLATLDARAPGERLARAFANVYLSRSDTARARDVVPDLEAFLAARPIEGARYDLAELLLHENQARFALALIEPELAGDPDSESCRLLHAQILEANGDFVGAHRAFRRLARSRPTYDRLAAAKAGVLRLAPFDPETTPSITPEQLLAAKEGGTALCLFDARPEEADNAYRSLSPKEARGVAVAVVAKLPADRRKALELAVMRKHRPSTTELRLYEFVRVALRDQLIATSIAWPVVIAGVLAIPACEALGLGTTVPVVLAFLAFIVVMGLTLLEDDGRRSLLLLGAPNWIRRVWIAGAACTVLAVGFASRSVSIDDVANGGPADATAAWEWPGFGLAAGEWLAIDVPAEWPRMSPDAERQLARVSDDGAFGQIAGAGRFGVAESDDDDGRRTVFLRGYHIPTRAEVGEGGFLFEHVWRFDGPLTDYFRGVCAETEVRVQLLRDRGKTVEVLANETREIRGVPVHVLGCAIGGKGEAWCVTTWRADSPDVVARVAAWLPADADSEASEAMRAALESLHVAPTGR